MRSKILHAVFLAGYICMGLMMITGGLVVILLRTEWGFNLFCLSVLPTMPSIYADIRLTSLSEKACKEASIRKSPSAGERGRAGANAPEASSIIHTSCEKVKIRRDNYINDAAVRRIAAGKRIKWNV